ncbi:MAG TPA: DegT/DnrJ/EryC1/StrS family aminotransferase, partial [bacterium]|nr:DegT/DnrJ/EryC1/StrS family aminotransferase [bacterium]
IPAYTFVATASAVVRANAVPVFADIDLETCNLYPAEAERKLSERTRAIIPVHIAGLPADMDGFRDLAQKYNLKIIEDACHSWGSRWRGKGTGALGDCGVFSFQMSKNITSGEGGLLVTDKEEIAETARSFSNCGREETAQWYQHFRFGTNIRMTEFQAAILLAQLSRLEEQTRHREATARVLDEGLRNIPGIKTVPRDGRVTRRAYHLYVFRFIEEDWKISRDRFLELLKAEGIPASAGYSPLYRNLAFHRFTDNGFPCALTCPRSGRKAQYENVFCPAAEKASQQTVWLPHWLLLAPEEEMEDVVCAVKKIRATF